MEKIIPVEIIESKILIIRKTKVMIDRDLADLYQVPTKTLNQAIKRNMDRFPEGFMFQLTSKEKIELVTNCDRLSPLKHSVYLPYAFTEYGVAMLSSVLNSKRAIKVNILIIQTFIRLSQYANSYQQLWQLIVGLERKYDKQFKIVFETLKQLICEAEKPVNKIGFLRGGEE